MTIAVTGERRSSSPPPSTLLAPGFRFHPTDEELVSYYLKRKVSGRPLRVDPISEVDLYKCEPWDLPAQSRIRSRDMEWYFFSPLDRKYANRSRTNRATAQGYWKTTGKDRQVRHGGRTVGMKKTLVFHVGRAPRGQRSNWVMHEYRLEGEDLSSSSIPQDSYVVCRIFQKNGPGPQNGAQYGAPFVEEEWEEDVEGDNHVATQIGNHNLFAETAGNHDYFRLSEIFENDENGNQEKNTEQLVVEPSEHNDIFPSMEPNTFPEGLIEQSLANGVNEYNTIQDILNEMPTNVGGDIPDVLLQANGCSPGLSDGYLELNDLLNNESGYLCNEEHINDVSGMDRDHLDLLATGTGSSSATEINVDEFFDILNEDVEQPERFQNSSTLEDDISLQANDVVNPLPAEYYLGQSSNGNLAYCEMASQEYPLNQEYFAQANNFLPRMDDLSGMNMVDELMAFFDATDDKLHYEPSNYTENTGGLDSYILEQTKYDEKFKDPSLDNPKVSSQETQGGIEIGASSSMLLSGSDRMSVQKEDVSSDQDKHSGQDLEKSFKKRLVNMLGSISSPPALAAEFPSKSAKVCGQSSATPAGGSIHVTAGMIHIRSLTFTNGGDHWSVEKNGSLEFLLSCGTGGSSIVGKTIAFGPKTNMHGGGPSVVLRGWFYVIFISVLFLAAVYRIGVSICSR